MSRILPVLILSLICGEAGCLLPAARAEASHAIAMHGAPQMQPDFSHFPYVNPKAPKGGRVTLGVLGSFDSLNPMIVRGEPANGIREFVVESLMARGLDEPFTLYGLIAESIEVPEDRSAVIFHLNPKARFSDGQPVTADDVIFSWELLKEKGRPNYRTYYRKVAKAERLSERSVRFALDGDGDRELPLILGLMPVLPKHRTSAETFESTSLLPPVGSGPYRVAHVDAGRSITFARNADYWGKDLPVNSGKFNFDEIRFDYFREGSVLFEAFKNGQLDVRTEQDPGRWAEQYAFRAVLDGRVIKEEIQSGWPAGMNALVFNTRRPVFADPRVRQALIYLFDFEWVNRSLYHGLFHRTQSYFERSRLAATGRPADARERELLAPYRDRVKPEILEGRYRFPASNGDGHNRENWRAALNLFDDAGYELSAGRLLHRETRQPLTFEILTTGSSQEQRLLASFVGDLQRVGIAVRVRAVDSAQYQARLKTYDYDMTQVTWPSSLSPGNEQLFRWSSRVARVDGSFNYAGVENPAADAMIEALLSATTLEDFVSAVHALDRVLLSGDYVIPLFHLPKLWVAHWSHLKHPEVTPLFGYNLESWWSEAQK